MRALRHANRLAALQFTVSLKIHWEEREKKKTTKKNQSKSEKKEEKKVPFTNQICKPPVWLF